MGALGPSPGSGTRTLLVSGSVFFIYEMETCGPALSMSQGRAGEVGS